MGLIGQIDKKERALYPHNSSLILTHIFLELPAGRIDTVESVK
jgi:hypothetical protein